MRKVIVTHDGREYGVIVRDDHPALVYLITRIGCREIWGQVPLTTIYPFHSERQDDAVVAKSVQEHLDQINPCVDQ